LKRIHTYHESRVNPQTLQSISVHVPALVRLGYLYRESPDNVTVSSWSVIESSLCVFAYVSTGQLLWIIQELFIELFAEGMGPMRNILCNQAIQS